MNPQLTEDEREKKERKNSEKKRKELQRELREWFLDFRRNSKCSICSYPFQLEFHHLHGKEFNVSQMVYCGNFSKNMVQNEIKKCQIVCHKCHQKIHEGIILDKWETELSGMNYESKC